MDHGDSSEEWSNSPQVNLISGERDNQFFDETDSSDEEVRVPSPSVQTAPPSQTAREQESSKISADLHDPKVKSSGGTSAAKTLSGQVDDQKVDPADGLRLQNSGSLETSPRTIRNNPYNSRENTGAARGRTPRLTRRPRGQPVSPQNPVMIAEPSSGSPPSKDDQDQRRTLLETLREEESLASQPQPQPAVVLPLIQPKGPINKGKGKFPADSEAFFSDPRVRITTIGFGSFVLMILLLVVFIVWRRRKLQQDRVVQYGASTIALKIAPVSTLPMFSDEEPPQWHPTLEGPIHRRRDAGQPIFDDIDWSGDEVVIEQVIPDPEP